MLKATLEMCRTYGDHCATFHRLIARELSTNWATLAEDLQNERDFEERKEDRVWTGKVADYLQKKRLSMELFESSIDFSHQRNTFAHGSSLKAMTNSEKKQRLKTDWDNIDKFPEGWENFKGPMKQIVEEVARGMNVALQ